MDFQDAKNELLHSLLTQSYELESSEENSPINTESAKDEGFYLVDSEDRDIIMHRDVHFGGKFDFMLEAYYGETKAAVLDTSVKRIEALKAYEEKLGSDIAPLILQGVDAEKVAFAKKMYKELSALFETKEKELPQAIGSLILSESEEPEQEIQEVVNYKEQAIQPLIDILTSDLFKDPLFPGYGLAPIHAADALGKLQAVEAIYPLIHLLSEPSLGYEEAAVRNLHAIGNSAKEVLMKCTAQTPPSTTNERAAYALLVFKEDPKVAIFFFETLKKFLKYPSLGVYLVLGCEELPKQFFQEFRTLSTNSAVAKEIRDEMALIVNYWDKNIND